MSLFHSPEKWPQERGKTSLSDDAVKKGKSQGIPPTGGPEGWGHDWRTGARGDLPPSRITPATHGKNEVGFLSLCRKKEKKGGKGGECLTRSRGSNIGYHIR